MLSSDKYEMSNFILDIQKKYITSNDNTLNMTLFGYLNEVLGDIAINSILMATEWGNEAFPIRSKFDRTVLTNAVTYNVQDINAVPATMQVMLSFIVSELETIFKNKNTDVIVINKENPIMIDKYEYHIQYDIHIKKNIINGNNVYTALYDMSESNPVSNTDNAYLPTPIFYSEGGYQYISFTVDIRQYTIEDITTKTLTNDFLLNKTLDFTFSNQLANFKISCMDGDNEVLLTPIVEGLPLDGEDLYCYYTYIDSSNIRIKFDIDSYAPSTGSQIYIKAYTTMGEEANFDYSTKIYTSLNSELGQYGSLSLLVTPITGSMNGVNRKSLEILKEIIPKEILSRGVITCDKDLENYFNSIDDNKLIFYKRIDNQLETLYFAYLLAKDVDNNIIPTNTISILATPQYINSLPQEAKDNNRYVVKAGSPIDYTNGIGYLMSEDEIETLELNDNGKYQYTTNGKIKEIDFLYTTPINFVINRNPISSSYYLDIMNRTVYLDFKYININSTIQFISNSINIRKIFLEGTSFNITMKITQNIQANFDLAYIDKDTNKIISKIKPALVFTNKAFNYYSFGEVVQVEGYIYTIKFTIDTKGFIDENNNIRIEDLYEGGTNNGHGYVYLPESVEASIYLYVEDETADSNSRLNADSIITNMDGYVLTNIYSLKKPFYFFYNYSDVIKSNVKWTSEGSESSGYTISEVPVIKYSYLYDVERCFNFIDYMHYRKACIDDALVELDHPFGIDFKFFNTYGPSRVFTIGYNGEYLDRVNISIKFVVKLNDGSDETIINDLKLEIKSYIEDLNNISDIHMSNLLNHLSTKFSTDIEFIDFLGINNYNALYKYLQRIDSENIGQVPEFLSINLDEDFNPDIEISLI